MNDLGPWVSMAGMGIFVGGTVLFYASARRAIQAVRKIFEKSR